MLVIPATWKVRAEDQGSGPAQAIKSTRPCLKSKLGVVVPVYNLSRVGGEGRRIVVCGWPPGKNIRLYIKKY
jgi:hypothetical protein